MNSNIGFAAVPSHSDCDLNIENCVASNNATIGQNVQNIRGGIGTYTAQ
jgi:hypothetical protein